MMTLDTLKYVVDAMLAECEKKNIVPSRVELTVDISYEGAVREVNSVALRVADAQVDELTGIPEGNYHVSVSI